MASFASGSEPSYQNPPRKRIRRDETPVLLTPSVPPAVSRDEGTPPNETAEEKAESPVLAMEVPSGSKRKRTDPQNEAVSVLVADDDGIDDPDPFGLKDQAKVWLENELNAKKLSNSGKLPEPYAPYNASSDGTIPTMHWDKAYAEYQRRFIDNTSKSGPSVLLVATNVKEDWAPGEEQLKAKYLYFPEIDYDGATLSALFIVYMPGPEHGAADVCVSDQIGSWKLSSGVLKKVLNGGLSSGSYRNPQPDRRIFPKKKYRNHNENNDLDKRNGNVAYSRFIWEVEWENRTPLDIRKNGKVLMRSVYNRLYLAAKIFGVDDDGKMEAAIVLWGRQEGNDNIQVMQAVSFGTKDLSEENKEEFAKNDSRCLAGVPTNAWVRPTDLPQGYPGTDETPQELMLNIPLEGILYKVSYKMASTDTPRYLTELVVEQKVTLPQLTIDLRELLDSVLDVAVTD